MIGIIEADREEFADAVHRHAVARASLDQRQRGRVERLEPGQTLGHDLGGGNVGDMRGEVAGSSGEHTAELQSLMRISYAPLGLKIKNKFVRRTTIPVYNIRDTNI